ncbi:MULTISPECIES: glycine zipper 2TM domain-containing protein [unclassified Janthinobacterium]|uniref:glycine zipper 2TM domain-containing protein n=1 Tax=unclassified Janthinobacterium TaxID=2610881 RepID=UPI00161E0EB2|nr:MULTISPECIES: glycine zipper 2TM domain-containing protein [unclassified Janthinobacterium]MBB5369242.1 outer membrane lipoprotein SlyB [Janthinobacterium sp. K2C7]MBB5381221.1 outer membrane lipoprotein SlyB [Janthinobacterium sp. K2Li3]MBB5387625.1 outer membrane lipoprotein SlyB [Janthinobacterium sp. K2E3]
MKTNATLAALMLAATAVLSGCANTGPSQNYPSSQGDYSTYGTIDSIQVIQGGGGSSGAGAIVGGIAGALLGNTIGSGGGRTAATVAGAVAGGVVGNQVENRQQSGLNYQISVRLDNGEYRTIVQDNANNLQPGNRVRIVDGRVYR